MNEHQTTIASRASLSGTGVHSGKPVSIHFNPADPDTGIVFVSVHADGSTTELRGLASNVGATDKCTLLGDPAGVHIATIEHLMAALQGVGIDNILIEVEGEELPILDGSSAMLVEALDHARIVSQAAKRRYIRILKPIRVEHGASWAEFSPYAGTRYDVTIDFESPAIGRQSLGFDLDADVFRRDIARARTFGFMKDVERLWAAGLALGSSLENSVVIGEDHRVINMEGLRYPDEFVRHKMLDAIGDLALGGARFVGLFRSYRGGHAMNAAILRKLLSDRSAFEIVEANRRTRGRSELVAVSGTPSFAPWVF